MIHIGNPTTLMTLCGKPVARRWWVDAEHNTGHVVTVRCGERRARVGPFGATCKECLKFTATPEEAERLGNALIKAAQPKQKEAPTEAQKERRGAEG